MFKISNFSIISLTEVQPTTPFLCIEVSVDWQSVTGQLRVMPNQRHTTDWKSNHKLNLFAMSGLTKETPSMEGNNDVWQPSWQRFSKGLLALCDIVILSEVMKEIHVITWEFWPNTIGSNQTYKKEIRRVYCEHRTAIYFAPSGQLCIE